MAAPSEYYVDPSIAAASGSGTVGDPYGDLQHALDSITRNATSGDRVNIKAGTAEILTAAIDLTTYGTPGAGSPLILEGYTSAAGDGGIAEIDGNATYSIHSAGRNYFAFKNLKLGNCGSNTVLVGGFPNTIINCEIHTSTGSGITGTWNVIGCWIHNIGGIGVDQGTCEACLFENGTNDMSICIQTTSRAIGNMFSIDGTTDAINLSGNDQLCLRNSILSSAGTGQGIIQGNNSINLISNNLIEGFSGTGGIGIDCNGVRDELTIHSNAAYDNATNYSFVGDNNYGFDNESLAASPFSKTGSLPTDFTSASFWSNVFAYFLPVDTGNVLNGFPNGSNLSKGAVQPAAAAAGGGLLRVNMNGNVFG